MSHASPATPPLPAVFEALNQIPKDGHGVDMMRVRDWALRQAGVAGGPLGTSWAAVAGQRRRVRCTVPACPL